MIDINQASERLLLHEGLRLKPYYCTAGKQTIGVGRNLDANPISDTEAKVIGDWHHGITKSAALYLLRNDIKRTFKDCKEHISFFDTLDSERQYALLDMAFNMGIGGLLKFKQMLSFLEYGEYSKAASECLNSNYAKKTGSRAKRIAHLLHTGCWKIYI
ncbi:MAG: lysozyme [Alphaproteobacteria bacterium]|nr:lysozyme [Alphaproteobacteria bacterium]